jgi:hypothetical protein
MHFLVNVRPILEYASCVWSPRHIGPIKLVESVQRKFTKRLPGYRLTDYKSRLSRLGVESLELRRLRQDLVFTYKVVFGLLNGMASDFFTFTSSVSSADTRGHAYKLFPHCNRVDVRKYFFCERVIHTWNSLPAEPEHFSSLAQFKHFVNNTDLTQFVSLGF